jgi:hypothetical protein
MRCFYFRLIYFIDMGSFIYSLQGEFADTGYAWDLKGTLLQQLGASSTDAAFCFGQVNGNRSM